MPDQGDAKPLRAREGRALNPTRGVARNGRPLVNTNCPSKSFLGEAQSLCPDQAQSICSNSEMIRHGSAQGKIDKVAQFGRCSECGVVQMSYLPDIISVSRSSASIFGLMKHAEKHCDFKKLSRDSDPSPETSESPGSHECSADRWVG